MQAQAERQPPIKYMNGSIPYSQQRGPPPPPPPPRNPSFNDRDSHSPHSTGPGYINPYGYGTNGVDHGNSYFPNQSGGHVQSPVGFRSEKSGNHKRSYDNRDSSSDEEEAPARRQEDDVTPKLKRRQPQVAEAYRYAALLSPLCFSSNSSNDAVAVAGKCYMQHSRHMPQLEHFLSKPTLIFSIQPGVRFLYLR